MQVDLRERTGEGGRGGYRTVEEQKPSMYDTLLGDSESIQMIWHRGSALLGNMNNLAPSQVIV